MQYKYVFRLCLLSTIAGLFACNSTKNKKAEAQATMPVYLYSFQKRAALTTDSSIQMVKNYLGIKEAPSLTLNKDENVVYFVSDKDLNTTFEQNLGNGNFEFSKLTKEYSKIIPSLPSGDQAMRIAESYLKKNNIYPGNNEQFRLVHTGGVRSQDVVEGKRAGPIVDKLITLTYGRVLDSLPVIGAGSKIIVNIGDKGEVVGLTYRWRELQTGNRVPLKSSETLTREEATSQAKKQIESEFGQASYEIKSVTESYYDANGNYVQPVWAFDVLVNLNQTDKYAQPVRYLCVIPLLKNSPEPLQLTTLDQRARELIRTGNADSQGRKQADNID